MQIHFSIHVVLRLLFLVCTTVPAVQGYGQGKFQINGRLKIEAGDLADARVVIYKDGVQERVLTTGLNKFSLDLDLNSNYLISFEKDGFVSKKLSFNTKVPPSGALLVYTPFDFAVSLFKQYDDLNMVVFNQPVGVIRYEASMGDFDYDTDYTKSIQSQLQQAISDVAQKQKEEAQHAAADAKRKAAEEKAAEKAKAEAEKQAIADARAKAEAEEQAAIKAKAEEQAAIKAKAEAERVAAEQAKAAEKAKAASIAKEEQRKAQETQVAQVEQKAEPKKQEVPVDRTKPAPAGAAQPKVAVQDRAQVPAKPVATEARTSAKPYKKPETYKTIPAEMVAGNDTRRSITPTIAIEPLPPEVVRPEPVIDRNEELIVEPNKVVTVIQLTTNDVLTEYRKVTHKWGGTYYFKNGAACTQTIYEQEVRGEQLAGATPRGKLDQ